jgi:hypothetical protein
MSTRRSIKKGRKQTRKRIKKRGGKTHSHGYRKYTGGQFKKLTCSPLSEEYKNGNPISSHETCLPREEILRVKEYWDKANPTKKIKSTQPNKIWKEIQYNLEGVCNDDLCILNQPFMRNYGSQLTNNSNSVTGSSGGKENNLMKYYSPKTPKEWKKNPTEWLSNIEILEKMKQYEDAYPCFEFLGPTPIDFDKVLPDNKCVESEMCHFQLSTYIKKGTKKIGIIFNTDPHDKGGSHWISLFINIPKKMIFFFDSAGDEAPKEVMTFVKKVQQQGLENSPPIHFKFDQNYPNEHQYSTTECGMYSLYFIINMLEDKLTTKYLKTHVIPDQKMIDYRKKYFNDV